MVELMKDDDDIDMETDPITEQILLGPDDDNINHNNATNNKTQDSSDSTGLEGLTQKTPDITHKYHPSNANYVNLDILTRPETLLTVFLIIYIGPSRH